MAISILISKMIFIKYLLPVKAQIGPKLKVFRILLKFDTFNISVMPISIYYQNNFYQIFTTC